MDPYSGVWREVGRAISKARWRSGLAELRIRLSWFSTNILFPIFLQIAIGMLHMLLDIFMLIIGSSRWICRGDLLREDCPRFWVTLL
jgi:hypothetical protein